MWFFFQCHNSGKKIMKLIDHIVIRKKIFCRIWWRHYTLYPNTNHSELYLLECKLLKKKVNSSIKLVILWKSNLDLNGDKVWYFWDFEQFFLKKYHSGGGGEDKIMFSSFSALFKCYNSRKNVPKLVDHILVLKVILPHIQWRKQYSPCRYVSRVSRRAITRGSAKYRMR